MKTSIIIFLFCLLGDSSPFSTKFIPGDSAMLTIVVKNSPVQTLQIQAVTPTGDMPVLYRFQFGEHPIDSISVTIPIDAQLGEQHLNLVCSKRGPGFVIPVLQRGEHLKIVTDLASPHLLEHTTFEGSPLTRQLFEYNKHANDLSGIYIKQRDKYFEAVMNNNPDTSRQKWLRDSLDENRPKYDKAVAMETTSPAILQFAMTGVKYNFTKDEIDVLKKKFKYDPYTIGQINYYWKNKTVQSNKMDITNESSKVEKSTFANNFSLPDKTGKLSSLSKYKGKYVLLDFWASWCGPCRREAPYLKEAIARFGKDNFIVLSVSIDENQKNWLKAIQDDGTEKFVHLIDDKGWKANTISQYKISSIPSNFLLDPAGKIIDKDLRGEDLIVKLFDLYKKN